MNTISDDHQINDLQEFVKKILAGTMLELKPEASHKRPAVREKRTTSLTHDTR